MTMNRTLIASLTLSASALVGLAVHEGYREDAYYATEHERERKISTIGFGDAQGVKPGQKTDPVRALIRLNQQVNVFEHEMRKCIGDVPMFQHEWNSYVALTFNIGLGKDGARTAFATLSAGATQPLCRGSRPGITPGPARAFWRGTNKTANRWPD